MGYHMNMDNLMNKIKNHKTLTDAEYDIIYNKLNAVYGDVPVKDDDLHSDIYPYNILRIISFDKFGEISYLPDEEREKAAKRLEYVLDNHMSAKESIFLIEKFKNHKNMEEIAKVLGVSRQLVHQRIQKALRKLHHPKRLELIWAEHDIVEEIHRKEADLKKKNAELSTMTLAVNRKLNILADALQAIGIDAKVDTSFDILDKSLDEYYDKLGVRAYNCCKRAGINTVRDLTIRSENDMCHVRNLGRNTLNKIHEFLLDLGYDWSDTDLNDYSKVEESNGNDDYDDYDDIYDDLYDNYGICTDCNNFDLKTKKCKYNYDCGITVEGCGDFSDRVSRQRAEVVAACTLV